MTILEKGHWYELLCIDKQRGYQRCHLRFVKRVGSDYPGNTGVGYSGTQNQEVLRVLIDRTVYLDGQQAHWINKVCIALYRAAINLLEYRAAKRHRRPFKFVWQVERLAPSNTDGHLRY